MSVYLLHFTPSYRHAGHYLGFAEDVAPRVYAHLHGRGARLTEVAHEAGCEMILVRVWAGASRTDERRMKNNSHVPRHCPICCGKSVQLPLLLGEMAYVPSGTTEEEEAATQGVSALIVSDDQLTFADWEELVTGLNAYLDEQDLRWFASQGIDIEGELADLQEDMADRAFWASGDW